jgi:hypothetical protein
MMDLSFNSMRILVIATIFFFSSVVEAQDYNQYLFLDDVITDYADYLLAADHIHPDHPLQQPFTYKQVFSEDVPNDYYKIFKMHWAEFYGESDTYMMGLRVGNTFSNGTDPSSYRLESILGYQHFGFIALNRTRIFEAYMADSLFAGDLNESESWLYGRVNDAYFDYQSNHNHIFVGKMDQNWGPVNTPSLILSNHPYSYNKLLHDYSTHRIKLTTFFSQLETSTGIYYDYVADTLKYFSEVNKYITGHRLDISINEKLKLAFSEVAIYGGPNRSIQPELLNPLEFYYGLQRNDRIALSGMWAVDLFYRMAPKLVVYGQFLLDDIIINNDPGVNDRAKHPDRLGLYTSLRQADYPLLGVLLDLSYIKIWNRTYQALSSWENYHYEGRSLGYPTVSSEEIKLRYRYWGRFPHFLSGDMVIGRYGGADVRDMFYLQKEEFPIEPAKMAFEHKLRYGWFQNRQLRAFIEHRFRHEKISGQTTNDQFISLNFDYVFIKD